MILLFTIIIPVKKINDYIRESVPHIKALNLDNWELIIITDQLEDNEWHDDKRIRIEPSGFVGPAKKRDLGASLASGQFLVFFDDDSYPKSNFLDLALNYFEDNSVVALGGPAITPSANSFWQKVSGAVFLSKFSGGAPERYVPVGKVRPVEDWPSVNFVVRRNAFLETGGFNSPYWPGEDTKFCLDLIKKTGKRILYIPEMQVWHHRREGLAAHLKQIGGYGVHRGYFAKRYPETSFKFIYFLPVLLVIFLFTSFFVPLFIPSFTYFYIFGWFVYFAALLKAWFDMRKFVCKKVAIVALIYIPITHFYYGVRFIQGLLTHNLVSRLR